MPADEGLDKDGYPTEEALARIRHCGVQSFADCRELLEVVRPLWWHGAALFADGRPELGVWIYELHTGGWSGNEDIIGALMDNRMFWSLCWESSRRGGHYLFRLDETHAR